MVRNIAAVAVVAALLAAATAGAQALIDGGDVRNNSLTGKDVRNKSLTKQDFKGSVRGPRGGQGPQGPQGPQGAAGANGFSVLRYVVAVRTFSNGEADGFTALCPAGMRPIGGSAWAWDTATNTVDHPEVMTSDGFAFV